MSCYAYAIEKATGEELIGPTVTMKMAVEEGWVSKSGSKWKTMPEVMIRYRSASFFGKIYAPEILNGMGTVEEVYDSIDERDVTPEEKTSTAETVKEKLKAKTGKTEEKPVATPQKEEKEEEQPEIF
jgi:hypothetical protein